MYVYFYDMIFPKFHYQSNNLTGGNKLSDSVKRIFKGHSKTLESVRITLPKRNIKRISEFDIIDKLIYIHGL